MGNGVMRDLASVDRTRTHLDRLHPARLGDHRQVIQWFVPLVLTNSRHREIRRLDDEIGWTAILLLQLPGVVAWPGLSSGHVLGIALRSAGVDPLHDGRDLGVAQ